MCRVGCAGMWCACFLVNAIVKDTLPRTGLLFAHKTQRTHPGGEGDGGGRAKTARQVHHASGTHTQQAPPSRPHQGEGDAHLHSKCTTRQAHTHTRACETALTLLSSPISDMLSPLTYPGRCHTPPRSSASCGSLAPRPLIFLVNAIVRDTLPRTGLLFAHKTQRTHTRAGKYRVPSAPVRCGNQQTLRCITSARAKTSLSANAEREHKCGVTGPSHIDEGPSRRGAPSTLTQRGSHRADAAVRRQRESESWTLGSWSALMLAKKHASKVICTQDKASLARDAQCVAPARGLPRRRVVLCRSA